MAFEGFSLNRKPKASADALAGEIATNGPNDPNLARNVEALMARVKADQAAEAAAEALRKKNAFRRPNGERTM